MSQDCSHATEEIVKSNLQKIINNKDDSLKIQKLQKSIQDLPFIDQVVVKKKDGILKVTRNPKGFVNTENGIKFTPDQNMFDETEFFVFLMLFLNPVYS